MAKTADALVAIADSQIGYDRYKDPEQGTKYGRWYAELTHSPWFGTNGVPFCAMFASWCLAQLGISCIGTPTASCTSGLLASARRAGALLRPSEIRRGDLILFNWNGAGYYASEADHVGIVTANRGSWFSTDEGNVDDGKVLPREREYRWVVGGIRPNFEEDEEVTEAEMNRIAEKVWAKAINFKNGANDKPWNASAGDRLGYIDYDTHTLNKKLDTIIELLQKSGEAE